MMARSAFPGLANPELALPTLLRDLLPWWLGALLLGAVFSAELSAGDAVLFMLSTSLGTDFYKTLVNPGASQDQLLRVTRITSVAAGVLGTGLAMVLPSVVDALTAFYGILTVVLMVPLLAGLYMKAPKAGAALTTMTVSAIAMPLAQFATHGKGIGILNPVALGILAGAATMTAMIIFGRNSNGRSVSA
jgi:SSS family solute:Na+ symporter